MAIVDISFGRGAGLGNRLFPWARASIFAHKNNLRLIAPDWAQIRRGALLKGGINYLHFVRKIWLFDNFRAMSNDIQGIEKWLARKRTTIIDEKSVNQDWLEKPQYRIVFAGDGSHFRDLHPHQNYLRQSLYKSIKPQWQLFLEKFEGADIGLNIRLGRDFRKATKSEDFFTQGGLLTPIEWFCQALKLIRTIVGRPCSAVIISDGTEKELLPLLELENVSFYQTPAAVTDLFALSKVKLLIGSGGSSFSAWASFLGKVPILSIPGQSFSWFGLDQQKDYLVEVLEIENPSTLVKNTLGWLLAGNPHAD